MKISLTEISEDKYNEDEKRKDWKFELIAENKEEMIVLYQMVHAIVNSSEKGNYAICGVLGWDVDQLDLTVVAKGEGVWNKKERKERAEKRFPSLEDQYERKHEKR